jgi:hypothetical protein
MVLAQFCGRLSDESTPARARTSCHYPRQGSNNPRETRQINDVAGAALQNPVHFGPGKVVLDADLARVLDAWPSLPEATRRAIVKLAVEGGNAAG